MRIHSFRWLAFFILVAETAGLIGLFFTGSLEGWYTNLAKPALNPPGWLFGPVWTILYALMGSAAYLVWRQGKGHSALRLYWWQLAVNALWTPLFFGLQAPRTAFADISLLLILIGATMIAFARVRTAAMILLIPYLAWVAFACYLNGAIMLLN